MEERRFVYLMGIIKWINLMTLFILMSNFFASLGFDTNVAIIFQLIIVGIISLVVNKLFEKKFGKQNLVENTLVFKIVNALIIIGIAVYLFMLQQYFFIAIIVCYMLLFSVVLLLISKNKRQGKGRLG